MRRLLLAFAVTLAALTVFIESTAGFEPWNQRHYPGSTPAAPMVARIATTSTMTWQAADEYGWPGWRDVVARALDTNSSDPESLGRVLNGYLAAQGRGRITIREAAPGEPPDMRQFAVSAAFMEARCGAAWATACVYLLNPLPVPAYYKAAIMQTYSPRSQAGVVRHETFHTVARACDQYRGGCPLASTGRWESEVICTGNPDTLMDCGGAAQTVTPWDFDTFVGAYPVGTHFLQVVPLEEWGECAPYGACWNNWLQLWVWYRNAQVWIWDPNNHTGPVFDHYHGWFCTEGCP